MNNVKVFVLMLAMFALFVFVGNLLGGQQGMILAFMMALVMNFIGYWFSDSIVLKMYRAKQVTEREASELYRIVRQLTLKAKLPMPKVYVIPSPAPNAFATGRNPEHSSVAVTEGILKVLNEDELNGVLAHELAHIQHRDILISTLVATLAGAIMLLARMAGFAAMFGGGRRNDNNSGGALGYLFLLIVAPIAALLIQMAISRSREYAADAGGSAISGKPLGLAHALQKLENYSRQTPPLTDNPSTAHLFIVNPLKGRSLLSLFSTHPPIPERVKKLEKLAQSKSGLQSKIIY
ncbi:MAG: zinc metalloprotease HtpX [Elusimicrobiota bacterium]